MWGAMRSNGRSRRVLPPQPASRPPPTAETDDFISGTHVKAWKPPGTPEVRPTLELLAPKVAPKYGENANGGAPAAKRAESIRVQLKR